MSANSAPSIVNLAPRGIGSNNTLTALRLRSGPATRRQTWEAWIFTGLTLLPIFFAGSWLFFAPIALKCSRPQVIAIMISSLTVTICFWMPVALDGYFGVNRFPPTTFDRRRDFATFFFAMIVGTGISYGMTISCVAKEDLM